MRGTDPHRRTPGTPALQACVPGRRGGIGLVGGTAWLHPSTVLARCAATVDGARSQVEYIGTVTKASVPFALVTVAAGLYLAFAGDHWGAGWPGVSSGLVVVAGAIAGGAIDPGVAALRETVDAAPAASRPGAVASGQSGVQRRTRPVTVDGSPNRSEVPPATHRLVPLHATLGACAGPTGGVSGTHRPLATSTRAPSA